MTVHLDSAQGLEKQDMIGAGIYSLLHCVFLGYFTLVGYSNGVCNYNVYTLTVHVVHAMDVGADPYCIVKVGRQKVVTPIQKNTLEPNFDCKVMFFIRNSGTAEVSVEVNVCVCVYVKMFLVWWRLDF